MAPRLVREAAGMRMTENERRILTLLAKSGPLSNKDFQQAGSMGWATVIKMVDRLVEAGMVVRVGTVVEPGRGRGKRPYLYDLSPGFPLAVGIDVEHETTTIALTNLKGESLDVERHETPRHPDLEDLEDFLSGTASAFLARHSDLMEKIVGVGIGLPRLELVSRGDQSSVNGAEALRNRLTRSLGVPVAIDGNIRVYTLYEKWTNKPFARGDFLLISIRGGLGFGVFVGGRLLVSRQGYPGALAHYRAVPTGRKCWCGGIGCIETVVNERYFHEQYVTRVECRSPDGRSEIPRAEFREAAAGLFRAAASGNTSAQAVLRESARYLAFALAPTMSVLNVPEVIVSGHFGEHGSVFARYVEEEAKKLMLPELDFDVQYYPLEDTGFTYGAALLILNRYFATVAGGADRE